ncbi:MAG TPA: hypothetical protein VFL04_08590, partial [Rectinemataceae bacterium]|nr:hypothetical protein [Rectinemataceae bacterium]
MCDTMYAGPGSCRGGRSWFGKNSDRRPDEPQAVIIQGRRGAGSTLSFAGSEYSQVDDGLAYVLSRPSWMAGGEMGVNEAGVAIGNEAVFSRLHARKDGVLGMDMLRAALASAADAKTAVDLICAATEAMDQGGRGSYHGGPSYSNSYLIADPRSAYVVETAGRRWAWKPASELAAISNAYSIEEDYKRLDAQTRKEISPVNERAACSDEADAGRKGSKESWRAHVEERWPWGILKGDYRRAFVLSSLQGMRGSIDRSGFLGLLGSHAHRNPARLSGSRMKAVCLHGGGIVNAATTASMAVEYLGEDGRGGNAALIWFTGTPFPCLSVYKPILLREDGFVPLWNGYDHSPNPTRDYAHWERHCAWARAKGRFALSLDPGFVERREALQTRIGEAAEEALRGRIEHARAEVDA